MKKILLTGMTSSQASRAANHRSVAFAGRVFDSLINTEDCIIWWQDPDLTWDRLDFEYFDAVLVGVAPITSLAANRTYGALHIINTLYEDPRLSLFIDAPNPGQITSSLRAIQRTPGNLTKPFYSNRPHFEAAGLPTVTDHLLQSVDRLLSGDWPTTLYPSLPWGNRSLAEQVPNGAYNSFIGLNLDYTLAHVPKIATAERAGQSWMSDTKQSKWLDRATATLKAPIDPMKINKGTSDEEVGRRLNTAVGALISPQKNGETWWSSRYSQAINLGVPVATEWRDSSRIGPAWDVLPSQIEDMSPRERGSLAREQQRQYTDAIPTGKLARQLLINAIGLD